ncbi:MAG: hypothetical protein RMJ56_04390 [Gemmataceae bacterium]|nr:hypothetical protein [Gemmata sp.]MDW8196827.1 hypothetical protein [Gemmataceae bacterium]
MSGRALVAAAFLMAAWLAGCEPAKEVPEIPDPVDEGPQIPSVSQPAAKKCVEDAVAAFTQGQPELVAKTKFVRLTLKGKMVPPQGPPETWIDTTRTIAAAWPDRFTFRNETHGPGKLPVLTVYLRGTTITPLSDGQVVSLPDPVEPGRNLAADVLGQIWMALMQPLVDPQAVVFNMQSQIGRGPFPTHTIVLALKNRPLYQLTFNAKTHELVQVEYSLTEAGRLSHRAWTMLEHKPGPFGLILPTKMQYVQDIGPKEQWSEAHWDFPPTIDDAEFHPSGEKEKNDKDNK